MLSSGYDKDWGDWIDCTTAYKCPCPGLYVQVHYGDGDIEEGIARDHVILFYAHAYRVRREVERDGGKGYDVREMEEA